MNDGLLVELEWHEARRRYLRDFRDTVRYHVGHLAVRPLIVAADYGKRIDVLCDRILWWAERAR